MTDNLQIKSVMKSTLDGTSLLILSPLPGASGQPAVRGNSRPLTDHLRNARWLAVLTAAILTLVGLSTQAQTYLIDFGGGTTTSLGPIPNDPVNYWNNVGLTVGTSDTGVLSNLISSLNATSSINLVMVSRFTDVNASGTQTSTAYPINATQDSLFGNTGIHGGSFSNIFPRFKLSGLDPGTTYSFTFYASRTGVGDNRETRFTITGAATNTADLDASNNIDNTVSVTSQAPDGAGEITIAIGPGPNNNNSVGYTYLGVLQVDAVPPQTPLTFSQQPASQSVIQLKPATFTASVAGSPPYSVQWYQNDQPLFGENQFTLTLPSVTLDMDGYYYSVTVSNLAYGVSSSNAVLTVLSDTNPPVLLTAVSYDGLSVALSFNELMDYNTTTDYLNYQVNGGAVQVTSAVLNPDNKTVVLTLSAAISGSFNVVVNNVQDFAGNPIAPNTSLNGQVIPVEEQDLLFDFGTSTLTTGFGPVPNDPDNYWNNVTTAIGTSDFGVMFNLVSVYNVQTPIGLSMISRFNSFNSVGTLSSTNFAQNATRDTLYGNTESFNGLANIFPRFKLTGLDTARQYTLTFYASRTSVGDNREAGYTVEGASTNIAVLNSANNINNTANVQGISPTGSGEITIRMAPTANNNNANHFTYLGVMRLALYTPPLQFLPAVIEGGKIKLEWTGTGQLFWAPTATGPWTAVDPAPTSPYEEDLEPGENRFYRLQE